MTNTHCDACGDPLFRYEGREFCPSCSQAGETVPADAEGGGAGASTPEGDTPNSAEPPSATDEGGTSTSAESGAPTAGGEPRQPGGGAPAEPTRAVEAGNDVTEARAALVRTLSSMARRAETTEDVSRAHELLVAAREAAEALAAIDRIGR